MDKQTYWLYDGPEPIGHIRLPSGSTDAEVRSAAIDRERIFPLGHNIYETPSEYRNRLAYASVRTFAL